ncbi:MAG TPA: ABC transporter permease [Acidimicrobiia bacterium]|nr:ABC transporter permease [Acidimicrobiia bacterium]
MEGRAWIDWDWIASNPDDIVERLLQHLRLTAIPLTLGFVVSLGLAVWALRRPQVYGPVVAMSGLLYTIPSLAAFAVLRPIFGLSLLTAIIPLTTYTLLILFRNIVAGFEAVPREVLEAAEAMGYTRRQRLLRVQIPLAVPLMIAGVRLAAVTVIGLATVASILGDAYGGLGQFITEGLQQLFPTKYLLGAILSVVLAFLAHVLFVQLEKSVTPWATVRSRAVG